MDKNKKQRVQEPKDLPSNGSDMTVKTYEENMNQKTDEAIMKEMKMAEGLKADTLLGPQPAEGEVTESNNDLSSNASVEETKSKMDTAEKQLDSWK